MEDLRRRLMAKVSVLIPARNEIFEVSPGVTVLQRTVQEVFDKATGSIEVLVGFDGPPFQALPEYPNLICLQFPVAHGTKPCLNEMAARATGKYLFKLDAHCALSEGFDEVLQSEMQDNWVVTPRFYVLDPQTWNWQDERFYDYFRLPCPLTDARLYRFQAGGHWPERTAQCLEIPVDENMKLHGSSFFVGRSFFLECLQGLSSEHPDQASGEDIEISLKTWLGPWDGRLMVNKRVWIAHMHKGLGRPRSWRASRQAVEASYLWTANYWMENRWEGRKYNLEWLIDRFWPVPGWPGDWREREASRREIEA